MSEVMRSNSTPRPSGTNNNPEVGSDVLILDNVVRRRGDFKKVLSSVSDAMLRGAENGTLQ